mgnify:CR=1 FL=1
MFNTEDFISLKLLSEKELSEEIKMADRYYLEIQNYFNELELDAIENNDILPKLDNLLIQLKNIEWYIRQATDLLEKKGRVVTNKDINTDISLIQIKTIKLL